ncbi:acylphosphatase [Oceanobacillus polygoni]|uniref:Acylphosphatase n=1 Tax=Oceanobacillus polygoni TaxID=1235259 RepID=A0A9X0YVW4_9BACI|nr:acylphosphatase [Oceanobacillus polygoni]MBP2079609.1 acylphosphatase [Oceanobacillus polygoni]
MKYVSVNVRGRVQGVGFRYFTQHTAVECNITGWVKNEDDGSVHIEAQGNEEDMSRFLELIKKGPSRFANVREMDVTALDGDPKFNAFKIKY